jgi:hypothetical protein
MRWKGGDWDDVAVWKRTGIVTRPKLTAGCDGSGDGSGWRGLFFGAFHLPRREAAPVETDSLQPRRRARRCDMQFVLHLVDGDGFPAEPAGQADSWPFPCVFGAVPGQGRCLKVLPRQRAEMLFVWHPTQLTVNRVTTRRLAV